MQKNKKKLTRYHNFSISEKKEWNKLCYLRSLFRHDTDLAAKKLVRMWLLKHPEKLRKWKDKNKRFSIFSIKDHKLRRKRKNEYNVQYLKKHPKLRERVRKNSKVWQKTHRKSYNKRMREYMYKRRKPCPFCSNKMKVTASMCKDCFCIGIKLLGGIRQNSSGKKSFLPKVKQILSILNKTTKEKIQCLRRMEKKHKSLRKLIARSS